MHSQRLSCFPITQRCLEGIWFPFRDSCRWCGSNRCKPEVHLALSHLVMTPSLCDHTAPQSDLSGVHVVCVVWVPFRGKVMMNSGLNLTDQVDDLVLTSLSHFQWVITEVKETNVTYAKSCRCCCRFFMTNTLNVFKCHALVSIALQTRHAHRMKDMQWLPSPVFGEGRWHRHNAIQNLLNGHWLLCFRFLCCHVINPLFTSELVWWVVFMFFILVKIVRTIFAEWAQ